MKNIIFFTLYDPTVIGLRLLSAIAKQRGANPYIIILKKDSNP